ncbi:MAG: class I SAM-dependent methyltransferase, partial [Pseudomonadota bacterium]
MLHTTEHCFEPCLDMFGCVASTHERPGKKDGLCDEGRVLAPPMDNGGTITDRLIAQAHIEQGAKALDFGCGGGDVTFRLAKAVGQRGEVLGIDLNSSALDAARQKARNDGVCNVTFAEHDIRKFAESGEKFDVIMCR